MVIIFILYFFLKQVYEDEDYKLLGKFCLEIAPPLFTSDSSQLALYFHSDYSWSIDGFTALYSATFNRTGIIIS